MRMLGSSILRTLTVLLVFCLFVPEIHSAYGHGYHAGAEFPVYTGPGDQQCPAISYNAVRKEYLVVWEDSASGQTDIYGRLFDAFARPIGDVVPVVASPGDDLSPAVACNWMENQYLVVWHKYNPENERYEIFGRFIVPGAPEGGSPFLIASTTGISARNAAVAWNALRNRYMVVWETSFSWSPDTLNIARRGVNPDQTFYTFPELVAPTTNGGQSLPDIVANGPRDEYLVVWDQRITLSNSNIHGRKISGDGAPTGPLLVIADSDDVETNPAVTTDEQNRYMVVWERYLEPYMVIGGAQDIIWELPAPNYWYIFGVFLDGTGTIVASPFIAGHATHRTGPDTTENGHCIKPDVQANALYGEYLTIYAKGSPSGDIIGGTISTAPSAGSGHVMVDVFDPYIDAGAGGNNDNPAAAPHPDGFFIVYDWRPFDAGSERDIYGRLISNKANPFFSLFLLLLTGQQ